MMNAERIGSRPRGRLRVGEPMSAHTSWRVGGPAERFYEPADMADLEVFLAGLPEDEPVTWVGLGSNLLVRDGGIDGTVILSNRAVGEIVLDAGGVLRAGCGATCARVARFAAREGLGGAAFLAGIPGTVGGALAMNAGAFGGETWDIVSDVRTIDHAGVVRVRARHEFRVGYRQVEGPSGEWFLEAGFALSRGDAGAARHDIRELLRLRNARQPVGEPSCGSVFRNPPGDHAARLIEASGLKGLREGGAQVSRKHANFIVNTGSATAADIERLIAILRDRVERDHGIRLEPEVRIVGKA